jgi:hypothetical protein
MNTSVTGPHSIGSGSKGPSYSSSYSSPSPGTSVGGFVAGNGRIAGGGITHQVSKGCSIGASGYGSTTGAKNYGGSIGVKFNF